MNHNIHHQRRNTPPKSHGFTMIEVLVVIVIIAILIALLLPAISSVRAAARRSQCQANLRSIGQGILNFESARGRLPAGRDQANWGEHSWATRILPYIEEQALYDNYNWKSTWGYKGDGEWSAPWELEYINGQRDDVEGNLAVAATNVSVFMCPETSHDFNGAIDYGGNYGSSLTGLQRGFGAGAAWDSGMLLATNLALNVQTRRRGVSLKEASDGISHTFLVMEDAGRKAEQGGMWANGHNCFSPDAHSINQQRSNEIFSDHGRMAHALLADGSVMALDDEMDRKTIGALSTRRGHDIHGLE